MLRRTAVLLGAVAIVAACAGEQDPKKAGFLDSAVNQSTGVYQKRQADLEAERKAQQQQNAAVSTENAALTEEKARLERRIRLARSSIASLEARIAKAKAGLAAEDARRKQLAEVETGLTAEKAGLTQAEADGSDAQVLAIMRQIEKLERDANTILGS